MNRNASRTKERHTAKTVSASLYEVIYVDTSSQNAAVLPKQHPRIAYVRQNGLEERLSLIHI